MISTAAVIHSELQWGIYRLLSDYLRFCGISVYNYILTEDTQLNINYKFDAVIVDATNGSLSESLRLRVEERYPKTEATIWLLSKEDEIDWNLAEDEEKKERIRFLKHIIVRLKACNLLDEGKEDKDVLDYLAEFFVEKEILKNRVVLQTFLNVTGFVLAVRKSLVYAYKDLLARKVWQGNPYYWYAKRHLERNINEACGFLKGDLMEPMLLSTRDVVAVIQKRIQTGEGSNPYRARLYFTIGHLYECDFFYCEKSTEAYQKGDELAKDSPFEFESAYRVGRCMEKQVGSWVRAIDHYKRALTLAPTEYRAAYKVGVYYWKEEGDLERACKFLKMIDDILHNRYAQNVLQPREAEYLYKAWFFIRQIIDEKGGPVNGITAQLADSRMEEIYRKVLDTAHENPTYLQIFGSNADITTSGDRKVDAREALANRVRNVCRL